MNLLFHWDLNKTKKMRRFVYQKNNSSLHNVCFIINLKLRILVQFYYTNLVMEEKSRQQSQSIYQIGDTKKSLGQLKQFSSMSRKQKNQLITYELLRFMAKLLNIKLGGQQFAVVPSEALIQVFINFLSQVAFEQKQMGQDILKNNLESIGDEIVILIEGTIVKQYSSSTLVLKGRKQSTHDQRVHLHHQNKMQRHKRQIYKVSHQQIPRVIWPSNDIYELKAFSDSFFIKFDKAAVNQLQNSISQQQRDHINYFLSHLLCQTIQNWALHFEKAFKAKTKTYTREWLSIHYLQIYNNSKDCQSYADGNAIVLTCGSILNLQSLLTKNTKDIVIAVQHEVSLFAIERDAILKIMEQYPWVRDQFISIDQNLSAFRSGLGKRTYIKQVQLSNQQSISDNNLTQKALQKFRKTIGIKKYHNRFRVSNTNKTQQSQQQINFISSFYPFVRLVDSERRIAQRNIDQRTRKQQINMLPQKDSKKFMAMKKRIHDEKVKKIRVKKRAQNQIRQSKYLNAKPNFADQRIIQNALFEEHLQIPQLSRRSSNSRNSVNLKASSTFRSSTSPGFEKLLLKTSNFNQKKIQSKDLNHYIKYKVPKNLSRNMSQRLEISYLDLNDSKNRLDSQINTTEQFPKKINLNQTRDIGSTRRSQRRILKKMCSGKIRKVKVVELINCKAPR